MKKKINEEFVKWNQWEVVFNTCKFYNCVIIIFELIYLKDFPCELIDSWTKCYGNYLPEEWPTWNTWHNLMFYMFNKQTDTWKRN